MKKKVPETAEKVHKKQLEFPICIGEKETSRVDWSFEISCEIALELQKKVVKIKKGKS